MAACTSGAPRRPFRVMTSACGAGEVQPHSSVGRSFRLMHYKTLARSGPTEQRSPRKSADRGRKRSVRSSVKGAEKLPFCKPGTSSLQKTVGVLQQ